MWPFRKTILPLESFPADDDWAIGTGARNGKPMWVRFHRGAKPYTGHPGLPYCLSIVVPFLYPDDDGMPDEEEKDVLDDIEDSLREMLSPDARGFLVVIVTVDGSREFIFYTRDADTATTAIERARERAGERNIQGEISHDPRWAAYKRFA